MVHEYEELELAAAFLQASGLMSLRGIRLGVDTNLLVTLLDEHAGHVKYQGGVLTDTEQSALDLARAITHAAKEQQ